MSAWREAWMSARDDHSAFWLEQTRSLISWEREPTIGCEGDFKSVQGAPLRWFADGSLNVAAQCLDRHLAERGDQAAIIWEADELGEGETISYRELHARVCRLANALETRGLKAGDRVIIYMGMTPDAAIAMLACARLGAVHSVVFGGFSAEALRDRVLDSGAELIITQDEGRRGGRPVALKATVDEALNNAEVAAQIRHVVVSERVGEAGRLGPAWGWEEGRDLAWSAITNEASPVHEAQAFEAEHPLFILYTSGSTGRPKGLLHTSGGYITYTSYTHRAVFELREGDVYACVADVGWITGHSYIVYGPLANGATTLMFESTPTYPDAGRYWSLVARHKVNIFYTAPTALRALAACGDEWVTQHDLSSLRVLGTVGEPINPEAWRWYQGVVGGGRCAIVDTWWQTETGGICISPLAPVTTAKPGAATRPLPGIVPVLVNAEGEELHGPAEGHLCLALPWPGQARTVWGDHERFVSTYFSQHPGRYFTGDGCRRDSDGDHWITGRVDDVLNVAGHRMGTAEFEAALMTDDGVSEAAVVGFPHPVKGQGVCAYVVLAEGRELDEEEATRLNQIVRTTIGVHAKLDRLIPIPGLPKTRSGKVMRRILRKIAEGELEQLGDTSTLADPSVVEAIKRAAAGR
jgi:acetyl-CoA synthetase